MEAVSILTVTINPALDKSAIVDQVIPDDKLECRNIKYEAGGGGINVARVLKRFGENAKALYQSSGPSGNMLKELLDDEGIDSLTFETVNWTRENFIVVDDRTKKQYRFGMKGPQYRDHEPDQLFKMITEVTPKPEFLVISGSVPPGISIDFIQKLCEWGKTENIKIILDTSGEALFEAMKVGVYLVKPNLKELSQITGKSTVNQKEQEEVALSLVENNKAEFVVVSLGPNGAMMASKEGVFHQIPPLVETKSTVGAGDSMVAGMVWALINNFESKKILQYGVACGTAATMNSGTGLCKMEDINSILATIESSVFLHEG